MRSAPFVIPLCLLSAMTLDMRTANAQQLGQLAPYHIFSESSISSSEFVRALTPLGDIDQDGFVDIALARPFAYTSRGRTGRIDVISGKDLHAIYRVALPGVWYTNRIVITTVGDLDGDGILDLAHSTDQFRAPKSTTYNGYAEILSGKTGKRLFQQLGQSPSLSFGRAISGIGDVNGDKTPDFAIASKSGIHVYSGKTFKQLYLVSPKGNEFPPIIEIQAAGDLDGDGRGDFIAHWTAGRTAPPSTSLPMLRAHSGKDGSTIFSIFSRELRPTGNAFAVVADVNKDKLRDIATVHLASGTASTVVVSMYSGKGGKLLYTKLGQTVGNGRDVRVYAMPDMDGDRAGDLVVQSDLGLGKNVTSSNQQFLDFVSGQSGKLLDSLGQAHSAFSLNGPVAPVGDLNGDRAPDLIVSHYASSGPWTVTALSTRRMTMYSSEYTLSLFQGGKAVLDLDLGSANPGALYFVIGSASGTSPGISLGSLRIPLNVDAYLGFSLAAPKALLWNNLGALDAQGRGRVGFTLAAGLSPSLAGLRLHHAALAIGGKGIQAVSNPVPIQLVRF